VDHISRTSAATFDRITQYLKSIYPALKSIESIETGGYRSLQFYESNAVFHPLQISDGTLRSLAVLVALFQRGAGAENVSVIGFEEPETALHPAAAGVLFDAMREASASVQVIATTHSADLLDKQEIDTDSILAVELDGGRTRIGHLDDTGRQALKQQLYTPGELMRMNYLRPASAKMPDDSDIESVLFEALVPA
jgi:predicted ATPase